MSHQRTVSSDDDEAGCSWVVGQNSLDARDSHVLTDTLKRATIASLDAEEHQERCTGVVLLCESRPTTPNGVLLF